MSQESAAVAAFISTGCASIAEEAAKGFFVWVSFELAGAPVFAQRVFTSLEKAMEALPDTADTQYIHIPYRMHSCGSRNVVYVYINYEDIAIVTNIAEDLIKLLHAIPAQYRNPGEIESGMRNYEYKLDDTE